MRVKATIGIVTAMIFIALPIFIFASNLPISKEASLIESVSPTEVAVHATGIANWNKGDSKNKDRDNYLLNHALDDGRKAAVYFVLFLGSDPLLIKDEEKTKFTSVQEEFFAPANLAQYISWEGTIENIKRTKREIEKNKKYELKIENDYKINTGLVRTYLETKGILVAREEITETLGLPRIMVIPATQKGQNPIELLATNIDISHAAKAIESYLTNRQYDVAVPEQSQSLDDLTKAQHLVGDVEEDYSYQLALSIGSDVYFTYQVALETGQHGTQKAIVNVRAYETTTARLLGTETGYSPATTSPPQVLIENAINDAVDKVLSRVMNYWKDDLKNGIQYKIIISISPDFDEEEAESISFIFSDLLGELANRGRYKENIVTKQTLDYLIWCDPEKYDQSTKLYRRIKEAFSKEFSQGVLKQVNINRKLVLLEVVTG